MTELYWGPMPGDEFVGQDDERDPYQPIYPHIPGSLQKVEDLQQAEQASQKPAIVKPRRRENWQKAGYAHPPHYPCG